MIAPTAERLRRIEAMIQGDNWQDHTKRELAVAIADCLAQIATLTEQQLETVIKVLNRGLDADRNAITAVMHHRTPCNKALTEHPTIQTSETDVGPMGIINGIIEAITGRRIMYVTPGDDEVDGDKIAFFDLHPTTKQGTEPTRAADPA